MSHHKGKFKSCEVENISSKLKFIAKLLPGQKISVNAQCIQHNTYLTSLVRYLTGENREKVYKFVDDLVQDSFSILESYSCSANEFDIRVCKNMVIDLINLRPGLENLKSTYKSDQKYVAKLEVLIENLDVRIRKLCAERGLAYDEISQEAAERFKKDDVVIPYVNLVPTPPQDESSDAEEESPVVEQDRSSNESTPSSEEKKNVDAEKEETSDRSISPDLQESVNATRETCPQVATVESPKEALVSLLTPDPPVKEIKSVWNNPIGAPAAIMFHQVSECPKTANFNQANQGLMPVLISPSSACLNSTSPAVITPSSPEIPKVEINSGMANKLTERKKKKKHIHQYDSYYMTNQEDIHLYSPSFSEGLIQ